MEFNPKTYQRIDYRKWVLGDKARQGINIKKLGILTSNELKVWKEAEQYQDARNDPGHGEITAYFAIKLLDFLPGNREIAIPTAICHDIGWYGNDPEAWQRKVKEAQKTGNLKSLNDTDVRMEHQIKGAELAKRVFERVGYPSKRFYNKSFDIIKDHDTRLEPTTESGKVVRDADYSWRVTLPCNQIYLFSKGITNPQEVLKIAEEVCLESKPPHNLKGPSKQIARIEIANTLYHKFQEEAEQALKPKYSRELEIIKNFYAK